MMTGNFVDRVNCAVGIDQMLLRGAEAEEPRAQLPLNICQTEVAAATVGAIRARSAAGPR